MPGTLTIKGGTLNIAGLTPGGGGGAATDPASRLRNGMKLAATQPVRYVGTGSSTTAGNNATSAANRYFNRLIVFMQVAYPRGGTEVATVASTSAAFTPNSSTGIQGYNAGEGGTTSANYLTSAEIDSIVALTPLAIQHMVMANDFANGIAPATAKANVLAKADAFQAALPGVIQVFVHSYPRQDVASPAYPWADYGEALAEIAAADPANRIFIDLSQSYVPLGVPGADPANIIDTDNIHQTNAGHALMAEMLRVALGIPTTVVSSGAPSDVTPPTVPTGLTSGTITPTSIALSWTASTDASGIAGYRVYRGGVLVGAPTGTTFTDTGLTAATSYSYTVSAVDSAGNESATSTALVRSTSAADTTAPSVPTGLTVTGTTSTTASLSWTASTDAVGVTGYRIRRGGTLVGSPTGTTFTDTGLTASTAYQYTVSAVDAAGNESAPTAAVTATTTAPPALVADTFPTDGNLVGSTTSSGSKTWACVVGSTGAAAPVTDVQVVGGSVGPQSGGFTTAMVLAEVDVGATDYTIEATLTAIGAAAAARGGGLAARMSAAGGAYFLSTRVNGTTQGWALYYQPSTAEGGGLSLKAQYTTAIPTVGDRCRLVVAGNTITAFVNGTQILEFTSATSNASSSLGGFVFTTAGAATRFDDFARVA